MRVGQTPGIDVLILSGEHVQDGRRRRSLDVCHASEHSKLSQIFKFSKVYLATFIPPALAVTVRYETKSCRPTTRHGCAAAIARTNVLMQAAFMVHR